MASPYLASLRKLHEHASRLKELGTRGDWQAVARESARNELLFAEFQSQGGLPASGEERQEARRLTAEILDSYRGLSIHVTPWLQDVGVLLKGMGGS